MHAEAQAARSWQPEVEVPTTGTPHVTTKDMAVMWDNAEIPVRRGTLVHVRPGSPLWQPMAARTASPAYRGRP